MLEQFKQIDNVSLVTLSIHSMTLHFMSALIFPELFKSLALSVQVTAEVRAYSLSWNLKNEVPA